MVQAGAVQAVVLIPAATEWGYTPYQVYKGFDVGFDEIVVTQNGFSLDSATRAVASYNDAAAWNLIGSPGCDYRTSIDSLQQQLPILNVNLFVTWYGNDLNCGACDLYPAVTDNSGFDEFPAAWSVNGISRTAATAISMVDGAAAYGGTPSDDGIVAAIKDLKRRGLAVTFTPFLLMDIAAGNSLTDPYTGGAGQPVYPWRGRITCSYGTDKSASAATQVASFAAKYRTFILHYANLCAQAGGVDAFVIGTELRGLTWIRDGSGNYPFVAALLALAAEVKAVLPDAKLTYAADWTEYFGHQPADASGDVFFHLDPLWASDLIDAIGIDNYFPLSDWRQGGGGLDAATWISIYDTAYLQSNIKGGEGYDWYYASSGDRDSQTRSPVTDGAYGKPWVYRYKDIWNWWANQHFDRPAGVESSTSTAWVPQSKPVWFTEIGCPAVNSGSNQPNVFHDPKSSESFFPYYSNGERDDRMQASYLAAVFRFFDPGSSGFQSTNNPVSDIYGGHMVEPARLYAYCWDARPYPWFPYATIEGSSPTAPLWADGPNYETGHWVAGRTSFAMLLGEPLTTAAAPEDTPTISIPFGRAPSPEVIMTAKLSIFNEACKLLGEPLLLNLTDNNERLRILLDSWDTSVATALEQATWQFGTKRTTPAQLSLTPDWGRSYFYQLPVDCARVVFVSATGAEDDGILNYSVESGLLATDEPVVYIRYITYASINQVVNWNQGFADFVASEMAFRSAPKISPTHVNNILRTLEMRRKIAFSSDAVNQPAQLRRPGNLLRACHGGR